MKRLTKDKKNGVFFGVCSGLGERFGVEPWIFRIGFILIPHMFIVYVILAIFLEEKS